MEAPKTTWAYLGYQVEVSAGESQVIISCREREVARHPLCPPGGAHLLIALGHAAVVAGHRVRYFTAADLVETLYRGLADNSVGRVIHSLLRIDFVVVGEIEFAPLNATGSQLFFRFFVSASRASASASPATGPSSSGALPARAHHHRVHA